MKINLLSILLFCSLISFSQSIIIKGKFIFEKAKPVELAEVFLSKKDSLVQTAMLKEDGTFIFSHLSEGVYTLEVKQWGEIVYTKNLNLNADTDLGNIKIAQSKEIQGIVVTGKKKLIERKIDRLVFNVENSVFSAGGDVLDILKVTPGVEVRNDQIVLTGKSSMKVMINDRIINLSGDDLINYLKTIPSDGVKSVEVITNPPAKYEAEGNSGLINIQLKKVKQDSWSSTLRSSYKQGFYGYGNVGGNFNYNKRKITSGLMINYGNGRSQGIDKSKLFYPKQIWDEKETGKYYQNFLSSSVFVDYQLTPKWNTGVQYVINYSVPHNNSRDITNFYTYNSMKDSLLFTRNNKESTKRFNSVNWYSNFDIDSLGRKLKVNFDYFNYNTENNLNFFTHTYNNDGAWIGDHAPAGNNGSLDINNYSGQLDMEHPLQFIKLQYGAKISFTETKSGLSNFTIKNTGIDISQKNNFKYKENVQSLYMSANKEIKKWSFQAGLRMEITQTEGNSLTLKQVNKDNYVKLFPTLYILYKANDNNSYSFNYGRRVERPDYNSVNPFRYYSNPYQYSEGNPFLKPVISNNIEFSYNYKDLLQTVIQFSMVEDNYASVTYLDKENYIQAVRKENYFNNYGVGIGEVFSYNKLKWLQNYVVLAAAYNYSKSKIYPVTPKSREGFIGRIQTNNTFIFNKSQTISAGFAFSYHNPYKGGEMTSNKAASQLDLFFKAMVFNKKMQISVQLNNIFRAYAFNLENIRNGIQADYKGYYDSRYLRISLSYKLGSSKIKTKNIEGSNTKEQDRIN